MVGIQPGYHLVYGFTPNGNIVSGGSTVSKIYNKAGEELAKLIGHGGGVWALAVEGDRLLSSSLDQTLKLWDLSQVGTKKTLEPTVSLFVSFDKGSTPPEPSEWVAWTKSGYYVSSLNGDRLLASMSTGLRLRISMTAPGLRKALPPGHRQISLPVGQRGGCHRGGLQEAPHRKVEVATILPLR